MPVVLVITNFDPATDEVLYTSDVNSWNVSKAQRDCAAGVHGKPYLLSVAEAYAANSAVEVDETKVRRYTKLRKVLKQPLIVAMENDKAWIIDGHHRLRALVRLGVKEFAAYVIEDPEPYIVRYNGERLPPFKLY